MLILKYEKGRVPRKKGRGSTLLNRPRQITEYHARNVSYHINQSHSFVSIFLHEDKTESESLKIVGKCIKIGHDDNECRMMNKKYSWICLRRGGGGGGARG